MTYLNTCRCCDAEFYGVGKHEFTCPDCERWHVAWLVLSGRAWQNSEEHGFHEKEASLAERIALMHSELSEALEADRHGNPPSEVIPTFTQVEEEFADLIIRILDESMIRNLNIRGAVLAKMQYNKGRPHKHGKKY